MRGGIGMGNTCKPMAVSFHCMTKYKKIKNKKNKPHLYFQKKKILEILLIEKVSNIFLNSGIMENFKERKKYQ